MNQHMFVQAQIDHENDIGYIQLSRETVARTEQLTELVLVDVDAYGVAVGIEVLSLEAEIPLEELKQRFHVHSRVVGILQMIQPTLGGFISEVTTGNDAVSTSAEVRTTGRRAMQATSHSDRQQLMDA